MRADYNTLGFIVMEILRKHSRSDFPVTKNKLLTLIQEEYNMNPSRNTLIRTVQALNEVAHTNIQGVGSKTGLWLDDNIRGIEADALFAPMITMDYLSEHCQEEFQKFFLHLRRKGICPSFEKSEPRCARQRVQDFLMTLEKINEAVLNKKQLGFIYNDLNVKGYYVPRCKPSHPDGVIISSVYKFFCKDNYFYMVGKREGENFLRNYRIDKMAKLFDTGRPAEPISSVPGHEGEQEFSLTKYMKNNYKMFNSEPTECTFELKKSDPELQNYHVNTVWDQIGNNHLKWQEEPDGTIRFTAHLPAKGALLFAKQFGDFVKLIAPADLRQELQKYHQSCLQDDYTDLASPAQGRGTAACLRWKG